MEEFYKELHELLKKYEEQVGTTDLISGSLNLALLFDIRNRVATLEEIINAGKSSLFFVHPDGSKIIINSVLNVEEEPKPIEDEQVENTDETE